jgi:hypothetical protein
VKLIELKVALDHGTPHARTVTMAFNPDAIISVGSSRYSKNKCWLKLVDNSFISVLCAYESLVFALRNDMDVV